MLSSIHKKRLIKVCKVLFPIYKKVNIHKDFIVLNVSKVPIVSWFTKKWKVSVTEMINYQIPNQLADFKYGNKTFINVIQEDLVRCELTQTNKIDYFLEEITKIKYSDIYKQFKVIPESAPATYVPTEEDEVFETMMLIYKRKEKPSVPVKGIWVTKENAFYAILLLLALYSIFQGYVFS